MHDLLRETSKKINGVENYYDRAQRSNTALAQEWTKEGSRSASATGQRLESKQQLAHSDECHHQPHVTQEESEVHGEFTN